MFYVVLLVVLILATLWTIYVWAVNIRRDIAAKRREKQLEDMRLRRLHKMKDELDTYNKLRKW